ncbi:DUF2291 family protein [Rubellimicrobium aerolatum]|uniref:DUF2291 family protein n=1 Tax=Rubellimicrobium aerolatum TaxID=490979 RepID=A0ABW0S9K8_9RHOB|nr:DUF2291 family protein [Rubellimicrobium aerolatum]MBP1804951.1 putative lipoprotein [Rubellimicrobium aerolatum]
MTRALLAGLLAASVLCGCKIVQKAPGAGAGAAAPADMVGQVVADTYEARLLPHVAQGAVDARELTAAIGQGLDAAGEALGARAAGGGAWNFLAKGEGTVVGADRESRAAVLEVDLDGDRAADLQIQLGPVVKGTALRDASPFYVFTDFKDQIEFAALARALNARATEALALPEGDLLGKRVAFEGAFALRSGSDPIQVVPTRLALEDAP